MLNLIKEKLINEYRRILSYFKQVIVVFLYSIEQNSSNPIKENLLIDSS